MEALELQPLEPTSETGHEMPAEPSPDAKGPCRKALFGAGALGLLTIIGVALSRAGTQSILPMPRNGLDSLESLVGVTTTLCSAVDCEANYAKAGHASECSGDATSSECITKCCTRNLHCSELAADFCPSVGSGFVRRVTTILDVGLPLRNGACQGEENCNSLESASMQKVYSNESGGVWELWSGALDG